MKYYVERVIERDEISSCERCKKEVPYDEIIMIPSFMAGAGHYVCTECADEIDMIVYKFVLGIKDA